MQADRKRVLTQTLGLSLGLFGVAAVLLAAANLLGGSANPLGPFDWVSRLAPAQATSRVGSAAEVVAGVLAVAITVVAIVVELAANRYTHRITGLFVREPVNVVVMSFFVVTSVVCQWAATDPGLPDGAAVPLVRNATAVLAVGMATTCLLILLPYFAFVFRFLSPLRVVDRMQMAGVRSLEAAGQAPSVARVELVGVVEELEDVARGAQEHSDRRIAIAAVQALSGLLKAAAARRDALPEAWFQLDEKGDPDFVAMAPVVLEEVRQERLWLETKVLRKFLDLFGASLGPGRALSNLIALETRRLAEAAHSERPGLLQLCVRFFNSYLRAAINAGDLRTAYYVLDQYRLLATALLGHARPGEVEQIAEHLSTYGWLGYEQGQGFLLEVVAHDLGELIEAAAQREPARVDRLLDGFLRVDREVSRAGELRLRGVRLAQVRLATFFLARGDEARARRVYLDMADERPERLEAVRQEILSAQEANYREFTDRGVDFAYLPPKRRALVERFYAWFEEPDP